MLRIAVVGCTGKLGSAIIKKILNRNDVTLSYAVARKGNQFAGKSISEVIGGNYDFKIIDDIENAVDIETTIWTAKQVCGLYNMDDFCDDISG